MSINKIMREIQEMDLSKKVKYECQRKFNNQLIFLAAVVENHVDKDWFAQAVGAEIKITVSAGDVQHTYSKFVNGVLKICGPTEQNAQPITYYQIRSKQNHYKAFKSTEMFIIHKNLYVRANPEVMDHVQ